MQIHTTLLGLPPPFGNSIVHIRLVNYLRYELRPFIDEWGIGRWDFGRVNRVGGAIFHEEGEESKDGANEIDDDYEVQDEEDNKAASHDCSLGKGSRP